MKSSFQEQQTEASKRRKPFPWVRLVVTALALIIIIVGVIVSLLGSIQGSSVLTVLGIMIGLCQWLFPVPSGKSDASTPSHPAQIIVHVPSAPFSPQQPLPSAHLTPPGTLEATPLPDLKAA